MYLFVWLCCCKTVLSLKDFFLVDGVWTSIVVCWFLSLRNETDIILTRMTRGRIEVRIRSDCFRITNGRIDVAVVTRRIETDARACDEGEGGRWVTAAEPSVRWPETTSRCRCVSGSRHHEHRLRVRRLVERYCSNSRTNEISFVDRATPHGALRLLCGRRQRAAA